MAEGGFENEAPSHRETPTLRVIPFNSMRSHIMFWNWWKSLARHHSVLPRKRKSFRPALQELEDRCLLSGSPISVEALEEYLVLASHSLPATAKVTKTAPVLALTLIEAPTATGETMVGGRRDPAPG
jgi:hypothetical protein